MPDRKYKLSHVDNASVNLLRIGALGRHVQQLVEEGIRHAQEDVLKIVRATSKHLKTGNAMHTAEGLFGVHGHYARRNLVL